MRTSLLTLLALSAVGCSSGSDGPAPVDDAPVERVPAPVTNPGTVLLPADGGDPALRAPPSPFDPAVTFDTVALVSVDGNAGVTLLAVNASQGPMHETVCNVAAVRDGAVVSRGVASWPSVLLPGDVRAADVGFAGLASQADYDHAEWTCSWR